MFAASAAGDVSFCTAEVAGMMWPRSVILLLLVCLAFPPAECGGEQPLSRISIHRSTLALDDAAYVNASPVVLGPQGQSHHWITVEFSNPIPSNNDWIGVFSSSDFNASICLPEDWGEYPPLLCTSPVKYQYANYSNSDYVSTGKGTLKLRLINQREDFALALFSNGLSKPNLVAVSNKIAFANPKAPVYPRLSQGKLWNEMTVTWTSGYSIEEAIPFVEWGPDGLRDRTSYPAGTLTFTRNTMCGPPARTVGWRDPGFIHTGFMKDLWPNQMYSYRVGHRLVNGTYVWSWTYKFRASPYPGQDSLQRVVIFGDLGKGEIDGSNAYSAWEYGALNTTHQLIKDLKNIDMVLHIGDICYANGYLSQWDQFTEHGNHERDWPDSGSFYGRTDSGGECGVLAQTMFYVPAENRAKYWYQTDYGMFRFCVADSEHDWRPGTEQYRFIEHCLATVDRQKQPWLVFLAHRVLGYSTAYWYVGFQGTFGEPMGRESLQELWQKYRVDLAVYGHIHSYERTCPIYQNVCTNQEKTHYRGPLNGTIHVVAGGGGAALSSYVDLEVPWSIYRDNDYGFVKLTAFNHSSLLFEYKRSRDGNVYDSFTITRDYRDIMAGTVGSCATTTLAI